MIGASLFLLILHVCLTVGEISSGYFDILPGYDIGSVVSTNIGVSVLKMSQTSVFTCLSQCLNLDGCWATTLTSAGQDDQKTTQCQFYSLLQPPSNLTKGLTTKLALRKWNLDVDVQERVSGTCNVYLLTGEDGVPDENFKCSSYVYDTKGWVYHLPEYGVLNNERGAGAWCAAQSSQEQEWLQVYLGKVRLITGIVTQGRVKDNSFMWVTSYTIAVSNDGQNWMDYTVDGSIKVFLGNDDNSTPVTNMLERPLFVAYVRIYPLTIEDWTCLRFDVLGC